ncbi:MAG: acetate kinase [Actinomycetaceae bacterium]|nr:acetate kinase [Actinomycetaceae bacterium]
MSQTVLVINSGSSSIKYQLLNPKTGQVLAKGLCEQIGEPTGLIRHVAHGNTTVVTERVADHGQGLQRILDLFEKCGPKIEDAGVVAVGHRVVQGGSYFDGPAIIDQKVHATITKLCPLAPLHNPAHLKGIDVGKKLLPDVPHVAVFDTAFFHSLPEAAATYALDQTVAQEYKIRRYGAHGTSHQLVSRQVSEFLGRDDLRQIVLHLGNGSSASAVKNGRAVDTSMGLTPLEGLVMGTRTGDIDPAVVFHLARTAGMSADDVDVLFNKKSGLLGLCGDNDMRAVRGRANAGDTQARLALDIVLHRLQKYVGAYVAVLNGLDVLTFTAGIGENDGELRAELCAHLTFMGIELDEDANAVRSPEPRVISTPQSKVTVMVVPTNEELEIARQAMSLVEGR